MTHKYDKPRVSVWDRLGNPLENRYERRITFVAPHISNRGQNGGGLHQSVQVLPFPSEGHSKEEAPRLDNSANNSGKYKKLESGVSSNGKLNGTTTIRRKRDFGESSTGSGISLVPLVGKGNMDLQYKETSGDPKRSKLVEEVLEATTISQVSACFYLDAKFESKKMNTSLNFNPMPAFKNELIPNATIYYFQMLFMLFIFLSGECFSWSFC